MNPKVLKMKYIYPLILSFFILLVINAWNQSKIHSLEIENAVLKERCAPETQDTQRP